MKKHKITGLKKYAELHEEKALIGNDGVEVTVRTHIPYAQKIAMAQEWVENTVMTHDDSCWYVGYEHRMYEIYLMAKYYTDINTDSATPQEIADFLINDGLIGQIKETLGAEYDEVCDLYYLIRNSFANTFDDDRSLAKAVRTSFGFLFNGEDVTESMAKAEATSGVMMKALDALNKKEKEESEKPNGGKMKVGGTLLNFARRME